MVDVAAGIITNGLGGNASNMILGHFHLGFFDGIIVVPPPTGGGGGGSAAPRPIPIRYDLDDEDDYPPEQKIQIIVKVKFGQIWREHSYLVLPKNASILVKLFNMINTTRSRINLTVSSVINKAKSLNAIISNFTSKNDKE